MSQLSEGEQHVRPLPLRQRAHSAAADAAAHCHARLRQSAAATGEARPISGGVDADQPIRSVC